MYEQIKTLKEVDEKKTLITDDATKRKKRNSKRGLIDEIKKKSLEFKQNELDEKEVDFSKKKILTPSEKLLV